MLSPQYQKLQKAISKLFKTRSGDPYISTEGQLEIVDCIASRRYPRVHCMTYTQYGKSENVAIGLVMRCTTFPEKWVIVAGAEKKAKIIMGQVIDHTFDNEYFIKKFMPMEGANIDAVRRERSQSRVTYDTGEGRLGEIMVLSAEGKRTKDVLDAILGFGAQNVILEESPLISDDIYVGVKRMVGGYTDNLVFELGNAVKRNHFYRTSIDPHYHKIRITIEQGLREARASKDFVAEMKRDTAHNPILYDMLYECIFPPETALDDLGYAALITETELQKVFLPNLRIFGRKRHGIDVAGGGEDTSTIVQRGRNGARLLWESRTNDTMEVAGTGLQFAEDNHVIAEDNFVDIVGIGRGVADRMDEVFKDTIKKEEATRQVHRVNFGEKPEYPDGDGRQFENLRAQCYWRMGEWLKQGGKLPDEEKYLWIPELTVIRWKINSSGKVSIMSKDEMRKRGIMSPNRADALAQTFARAQVIVDMEQNNDIKLPKTEVPDYMRDYYGGDVE